MVEAMERIRMEAIHVINVGKCLDIQTDLHLEAAVPHIQEQHGRHIVLNLQVMETMDSRGLGNCF